MKKRNIVGMAGLLAIGATVIPVDSVNAAVKDVTKVLLAMKRSADKDRDTNRGYGSGSDQRSNPRQSPSDQSPSRSGESGAGDPGSYQRGSSGSGSGAGGTGSNPGATGTGAGSGTSGSGAGSSGGR